MSYLKHSKVKLIIRLTFLSDKALSLGTYTAKELAEKIKLPLNTQFRRALHMLAKEEFLTETIDYEKIGRPFYYSRNTHQEEGK